MRFLGFSQFFLRKDEMANNNIAAASLCICSISLIKDETASTAVAIATLTADCAFGDTCAALFHADLFRRNIGPQKGQRIICKNFCHLEHRASHVSMTTVIHFQRTIISRLKLQYEECHCIGHQIITFRRISRLIGWLENT